MIEVLSGQRVNTYMYDNVFFPLGINAAYHPAPLKDTSDISNRLTKDGKNHETARHALNSIEDYDNSCNPLTHTGITSGNLYISI